jgi:hypothetical protein
MIRTRNKPRGAPVVLAACASLLVGVNSIDAQTLTLRDDGIGFPDGSVQTTAASVVGTPIDSMPVDDEGMRG